MTAPDTARPAIRLLRLADCRVTPWKNGGGTTTEYAAHPPGAGLDAFDWRISRARVASDGPFSTFPGVDRTLSVVTGDGIDLVFADRSTRLDPTTPPFAFPGDVAVEGRLIDGPIDDLNVMTRRGRWRHRVTRHRLEAPRTLALAAERIAIITIGSAISASIETKIVRLDDGDCALLAGPTAVTLTPLDGPVAALVVELARDA